VEIVLRQKLLEHMLQFECFWHPGSDKEIEAALTAAHLKLVHGRRVDEWNEQAGAAEFRLARCLISLSVRYREAFSLMLDKSSQAVGGSRLFEDSMESKLIFHSNLPPMSCLNLFTFT
jgi:hypothetical protein